MVAHQRVMAFLERQHAVVAQSDGPPETTTSPCVNCTRMALSALFKPPNNKTAGIPSETETMGWSKSCSFLS
jgi:hypothetical protein